MLGDVGTCMGLIGKQNLLQLRHYMCYVITKISPASSRTSPMHAAHCLLPHPAPPHQPPPPPPTHPARAPHPHTLPAHAAHARHPECSLILSFLSFHSICCM